MIFRVLACLVCLGTAASAETYKCDTQNRGPGGWVGDFFFLAFDRPSGAGSVLDWAIQKVHKAPIPVDVRHPSDHRWEFRYTVKGVPTSNAGSGIVSYRIILNTRTSRFSLSGRLHGSDNNISGSGTCKRVKGT